VLWGFLLVWGGGGAGKGGRCVRLTLPPSCANCLEILQPQPPGPLRACSDLHRNCLTIFQQGDKMSAKGQCLLAGFCEYGREST